MGYFQIPLVGIYENGYYRFQFDMLKKLLHQKNIVLHIRVLHIHYRKYYIFAKTHPKSLFMCNCKNNKKINSEAFFHSHYFLMNIINSSMKCNTEGLFVLSQAGPVLSQTNRTFRVFVSFETNKTMSSVSISHYTLRLSLIISRTIQDKPWH